MFIMSATPNNRTLQVAPAPFISIEGTAVECGRQYGEIVRERYPGYRVYLNQALQWNRLGAEVLGLVERRAPYLLDLYRGLCETGGSPAAAQTPPAAGACTSFGVADSVTLDGGPLSGQTKDTEPASASLYIVLCMCMQDAPTLLVLAYPGEVLGYGLWSTGMSIFRNSLHSAAGATKGLTMVQWSLLALAGDSVQDAVELARIHGLADTGNCLLSDGSGASVSVEFNAGGVSVLPARDGIAAHANHPEGPETEPFGRHPDEAGLIDSRKRAARMRELLERERGRLTPQKAMMLLADHGGYPWGICNHLAERTPDRCTTAAVVAEPAAGCLHVACGSPCANWPKTYSMNGP